MLPLLLTFVLLNATSPVIFDGQAIAYVYLNGTTAKVDLPLLPGEHNIKYLGKNETLKFFDTECSAEGILLCNISAYTDISLPVWLSCGNTLQKTLQLKKGDTEAIKVEGVCRIASIMIGDYYETLRFTPVFTNYIVLDKPQNITILKDGVTVLKKFGKDYVSFPELENGEYIIEYGDTTGKLLIRPIDTSAGGYLLAGLLVILTLGLLFWG